MCEDKMLIATQKLDKAKNIVMNVISIDNMYHNPVPGQASEQIIIISDCV